MKCSFVAGLVLAALPWLVHARVVINEVMYHAPDDLQDLQYIELHNTATTAVDLGGWKFTKGIDFTIPAGTRIEPKGYMVFCQNAARFTEFYTVPVAGVFTSALSRKGERLELTDSSGKVVDTFKFKDRAPWPTGADGYSGSLERITPEADGDDPANWIASPLSEDRSKPGGTPGRPNAGFSEAFPPAVSDVRFSPAIPAPAEAIRVEVDARDPKDVEGMTLLYRLAGPGYERDEVPLPMSKITARRFAATIPGQPANQLVRFRIRITGARSAQRTFPAPTEPRPALSIYVPGTIEPAKVPFGWIIHTIEAEARAAQELANRPAFGGFGPPPGPGPAEETREKLRGTLEQALDLSKPWYELTVHVTDGNVSTIQRLRPIYVKLLEDRKKVIDALLSDVDPTKAAESAADTIAGFLKTVLDASRTGLDARQFNTYSTWLAARAKAPVSFERMIHTRADLEGAWHALTLGSEPDFQRLAELVRIIRELDTQRRAILAEVATGKGEETAFRDQRDAAESLGGRIFAALKDQLTADQSNRLAAWQTEPREVTVGLRAATPARREGGPGVGGGPFGFGGPFGGRQSPSAPASHRSAFVHFDPENRTVEVFDFVQITERKGGRKVHFHKDRMLRGMTTVNLIYENDVAALVEPLAYELYRRSGMPAALSHHLRLWINGKPAGYQLLFEQPNRGFLRRNQIRDDGNMYKLLWFENGVVGQHEVQNNRRAPHDDIVQLIDGLNKASWSSAGLVGSIGNGARPVDQRNNVPGDAQWDFIRANFDVDQVATYFAVNMVLSHWDGFFNNYFTYHDLNGTGKWTMYPWDQDSTWGVRVMGGGGAVFFDMPLTFGMAGDEPAGGWWRPPGWFSGPLLANPRFRRVFLEKTRSILENVYTEAAFGPVLDSMQERLEPEVRERARIQGADPTRAAEDLQRILQGCREHLKLRREFLLSQDEIRKLPKR